MNEALTLALEVLKAAYVPADLDEQRERAITELEALAQPEQHDRPLQIAMRQWEDWKAYALDLQKKLVKYEGGSPMILNTQPERPWVGLTKGEINSALSRYQNWYDFAAHLENILKEKNQ